MKRSSRRGVGALAMILAMAAVAGSPGRAFTIYSPIALVADDPEIASRLHASLSQRYRNLVVRGSLAEARSEAAGEQGFEVAIVVSTTRDRGTVTAYGAELPVCQVMVTAQVVRLPQGRLELSRATRGKAPDCALALEQADAKLGDELLKALEEYRRRGVERGKEFLWVQLVDDWSDAELAELRDDLLKITGVRVIEPGSDAHLIKLEVYREPRALAREMNSIASVRVSRFFGRRVTLSSLQASARAAALPSPPATTSATPAPAPTAAVPADPSPRRPLPAGPPAQRRSPPPEPIPRPGSPPLRTAGPLPEVTGERWALVVGVSKFEDASIPELTYPVKDARAFAQVLMDPNVGRFAPDRVYGLFDHQATTQRLKLEIDYLAHLIQPEDLFLFFVSTHAAPGKRDVAGDAYIVTHDTDTGSLYATGFPMRELVDALTARIQAQTVIGILDACYTGQIVDRSAGDFRGAKALTFEPGGGEVAAEELRWSQEWQAISPKSGPPELAATGVATPVVAPMTSPAAESAAIGPGFPSPDLEVDKRIVFMTSSDGHQPSWESEELGHSFFTYYLMEALRLSRGQATVASLFNYVKEEVRRAVLAEKDLLQEPVIRYNADLDFSIAGEPH